MSRRTLWIVLCVVSMSAGCGDTQSSDEPEPDPGCEGAKCDADEVVSLPVVPPAVWGRCTIEAELGHGGADALMCQAVPSSSPLKYTQFLVTAHDADDRAFASGVVPESDLGSGWVFDIEPERYPIRLDITISFPTEAPEPRVEGFSSRRITLDVVVESAADLADETPLLVEQPFALWPVQVLGAEVLVAFEEDRGPRSLDPWYAGVPGQEPGEREHRGTVVFFPEQGQIDSFYAVPPDGGGAIVGSSQVVNEEGGPFIVDMELPGPGRWVATTEGLRPPTEEELALFSDQAFVAPQGAE